MNAQKAMLRFVRDSERDIKIRDIQVHVDGKHLADVYFRQSAEVEVEPGIRQVLFDNTLSKKRTQVEAKAGQVYTFNMANVASGCLGISVALIGVGPYSLFVGEPTAAPMDNRSV